MNKRIVSFMLVFVLLSLVAVTPAASVQASGPVAVEAKAGADQQQTMRFLRIDTLVQHCTTVFTGFPPVLNPTGCSPLNSAFWEYNYNGSNYVQGPATNSTGWATTYFPVPIGVGGTIRCRGYQMEWIAQYTANQPGVTCYLYSLRT